MTESTSHQASRHWAQIRESGTLFGIQFCYWVHRLFGRWMFRLVLVPIMGYFFLVRAVARRASLDYQATLERWRPGSLPGRPGHWLGFRHFLSFGESMLDKVISWSGGVTEDDIDIRDPKAYRAVKAESCGRLLVGSHFGNLEVCRAFARQNRDVVINVLVHNRHAVNFNRMLAKADPGAKLNLYAVDALDVGTILALKDKVSKGEWLVIAADRIPVSEQGRTVGVEFMGRPARLPVGPYVLAHTLECPVTLVFGWREGARVALCFEPFADRLELPRAERDARLREHAQQFAHRLESYCAQAPLQWFNFYPFWSDEVSQ